MNFTLKLALSEIVKNKSKVLIAIIVTLILFMSAFTLCNISTALPKNFYNYYEEYMHDTIGVYINNADQSLYENKDKYFVEFMPQLDVACRNYSLIFNGVEQLPYDDYLDNYGEIVTNYYNNILLNSDYDPEIYKRFFDTTNADNGNVWKNTFDEEGIWIADFAVSKFVGEKKEGGSEPTRLKAGDFIDYKLNGVVIKLKVNGIFDGESLRNYIVEKTGSNMINDYLCFITETSAKQILFESKSTFKAYGVVGKIDKLYDVYNTLHGKYSLSEGTAFSLIAQVKNSQIICMIVGVIMIICGIVILLNFINMILSQNIKHISLLRILGMDTFKIMTAYYLIFLLLITIVCVVSWMTLPLYNYFVSLYCTGLGYPFAIGINYWVVVGVFGICYLITTALMLVKWAIMDKTAPNSSILEED